jgi:hypothetical protein
MLIGRGDCARIAAPPIVAMTMAHWSAKALAERPEKWR